MDRMLQYLKEREKIETVPRNWTLRSHPNIFQKMRKWFQIRLFSATCGEKRIFKRSSIDDCLLNPFEETLLVYQFKFVLLVYQLVCVNFDC